MEKNSCDVCGKQKEIYEVVEYGDSEGTLGKICFECMDNLDESHIEEKILQNRILSECHNEFIVGNSQSKIKLM